MPSPSSTSRPVTLAEAGRDAVDRAGFLYDCVDNCAGPSHFLDGARVQSDRPAIESNFINVFNRETLAVDQQRIHSSNDIANSPPKLGGVPSAARRGGSKENHPVFAHFF